MNQNSTTGWQPIETAPLQKILLLFAVTDISENGEVRNWKMATGSADHRGWLWGGHMVQPWDVVPTHWMPLPEPPL
jgi:hypothetical protein